MKIIHKVIQSCLPKPAQYMVSSRNPIPTPLYKQPTMRHSFLKSTFDPSNFKTYNANCHCGAIRYQADVSPPLEADHEVVTCDCKPTERRLVQPIKILNQNVEGAMCIRTGSWNVYVPVETVTFTRGQDKLKVTPSPITVPKRSVDLMCLDES